MGVYLSFILSVLFEPGKDETSRRAKAQEFLDELLVLRSYLYSPMIIVYGRVDRIITLLDRSSFLL
jgi:hypothetical protein